MSFHLLVFHSLLIRQVDIDNPISIIELILNYRRDIVFNIFKYTFFVQTCILPELKRPNNKNILSSSRSLESHLSGVSFSVLSAVVRPQRTSWESAWNEGHVWRSAGHFKWTVGHVRRTDGQRGWTVWRRRRSNGRGARTGVGWIESKSCESYFCLLFCLHFFCLHCFVYFIFVNFIFVYFLNVYFLIVNFLIVYFVFVFLFVYYCLLIFWLFFFGMFVFFQICLFFLYSQSFLWYNSII